MFILLKTRFLEIFSIPARVIFSIDGSISRFIRDNLMAMLKIQQTIVMFKLAFLLIIRNGTYKQQENS